MFPITHWSELVSGECYISAEGVSQIDRYCDARLSSGAYAHWAIEAVLGVYMNISRSL